jgi:hypothetical protein
MIKKLVRLSAGLCGLLLFTTCSPSPQKVSTSSVNDYLNHVVYARDPKHPNVCFAFFGAEQTSTDLSSREFVNQTYVPCELVFGPDQKPAPSPNASPPK